MGPGRPRGRGRARRAASPVRLDARSDGASCPDFSTHTVEKSGQQREKLSEHRAGRLRDIAPRVAAELVAARVGLALALAVPLPRVARVVEAVAVELDSQPVVRPAAVDVAA